MEEHTLTHYSGGKQYRMNYLEKEDGIHMTVQSTSMWFFKPSQFPKYVVNCETAMDWTAKKIDNGAIFDYPHFGPESTSPHYHANK